MFRKVRRGHTYYRRRAEEERERVRTADVRMAVIHQELADRYQVLVDLLDSPPEAA